MKCFQCSNRTCRTEYPTSNKVRYVQSVCDQCSWRSSKVIIPSKLPPANPISLEKRSKSNIFDIDVMYKGVWVDSMSQNLCGVCQCVLFSGDETYNSQFGMVDVLCFRSLEILERVWDWWLEFRPLETIATYQWVFHRNSLTSSSFNFETNQWSAQFGLRTQSKWSLMTYLQTKLLKCPCTRYLFTCCIEKNLRNSNRFEYKICTRTCLDLCLQ